MQGPQIPCGKQGQVEVDRVSSSTLAMLASRIFVSALGCKQSDWFQYTPGVHQLAGIKPELHSGCSGCATCC